MENKYGISYLKLDKMVFPQKKKNKTLNKQTEKPSQKSKPASFLKLE